MTLRYAALANGTVRGAYDAAMAKAMADVLVSPPDRALLRQRSQEFTVERSVDGYLGALFGEA